MNELVSVIIPTYGGNESLMRALDSVLLQDYVPFEVIVVDDNNPGTEQRKATESIMADYRDDKKVTYVLHEKNKNGSAARNTGAKMAKGGYLAFLDDDDIFLQGKLRKQVLYLDRHSSYDAVYCWRLESGKIIGSNLKGNLSAPLLDLTFTPCTCSLLIRKEAFFDIHGFDESYCRHQDFEFLLRFFEKYKIGVVEEPLIEIIGNSVDNQPRGDEAVRIKKKFLDTFSDNITKIERRYRGYRKHVYARHYGPLMVKLLRYGDLKLAVLTYFKEAHQGGFMFWLEFTRQIIFILKKYVINLRREEHE